MRPFFESLPSAVELGGRVFPVVTGFRNWLKFHALILDHELTDEDKLYAMLQWYANDADVPDTLERAIQGLLWFFRCGRDIAEVDPSTTKKAKKANSVDYDPDKCQPLIHAAFLQLYGIDLYSADLHWWAFCSLMEGLPQGTRFADVLVLLAEPVGKETREQKSYRAEIRALYGQGNHASGRPKTLKERDEELIARAKRARKRA